MSLRTTLGLLLLLAGLAGVVLWQQGREGDELALQRRLFEGVEVSRVVAIRVDHIERGYNLRLERDEGGRWYLTDPVAYPAAPELVQLLLEDVAGAVSVRVPAAEEGEEELGFAPTRCVVLEDSGIGNKAAKAAGMACCVTISTYTGDEDFTGADKVRGGGRSVCARGSSRPVAARARAQIVPELGEPGSPVCVTLKDLEALMP